MTDPDRAWLRSLPLLLSAAVLLLGGSWAFFRAEDDIASVAAFTAALLLIGAWTATVVVDHDHRAHGHGAPGSDGPDEADTPKQ